MLRLSQLAEDVTAILNNHLPPEIRAVTTLDWVAYLTSNKQLTVLVCPDVNQYNIETSTGRRRLVQVHVTKYINVIVGKTFVGIDQSGDIAPWSESVDIIDTREMIEDILVANWPNGTQLVSIEAAPIDEQELDNRNFSSITAFGYDVMQCGSQ